RAFLLQETGRLQAALADYDKAIAAAPDHARAWNGRGSVLHALKRDHEALAHFDKALELDPALAEARTNRAHLRWSVQGDHHGAVSDLRAALESDPDAPYARGELLHLKMFAADWQDFESECAVIDDGVRQGRRVVRPFVYQALSSSPADLQACSRIFAGSLFPAQPPRQAFFPRGHEKIR